MLAKLLCLLEEICGGTTNLNMFCCQTPDPEAVKGLKP